MTVSCETFLNFAPWEPTALTWLKLWSSLFVNKRSAILSGTGYCRVVYPDSLSFSPSLCSSRDRRPLSISLNVAKAQIRRLR